MSRVTPKRTWKNKLRAMDVHLLSRHLPLLPGLLVLVVVAILFTSSSAHAATHQLNPNCRAKCGSVEIPFPFGTTEGCALDSSFLIHCNKTSSSSSNASHTPFLPRTNYNMSVLSISLNGELRVSWPAISQCYANGSVIINATRLDFVRFRIPFNVSTSRNKLTAVGCDTVGMVGGWDSTGKRYVRACASVCDVGDDFEPNGFSCATAGCCEASLPRQGLSDFAYQITSLNNHSYVTEGFSPCGHAFVMEDGAYRFEPKDLSKFETKTFPVVLDWTVGNHTCQQAKKNHSSYACKADNSTCWDSTKGPGYLCNCSTGFRGNPYLPHGCRDINECRESNDCVKEAKCINTPGSHFCECQKGYDGDGKNYGKGGKGCTPKSRTRKSRTEIELMIALIVSVCIIALLVVSIYAYWGLKKRKLIKLKEQFFQQNGGMLLQQKIAKYRGSTETAKVFTIEELKKATNNFAEGKILGQGGQGTVYKGLLPDNRTVAIKKSKICNSSQVEQFINEVIVLSQINHRNVVKLLGCCLEIEVPMLVYEFIPNGTVSEHLHDQSQSLKLDWKTRLRIAAETVGALAYLHSATSPPVIHRDVKTSNILLDHDLTTKVSDFGTSKIVPLDKSQVTTLVQGTLGYLDPEYFHTSQLTEKSDVYSFGVVLAELLTGRKALSFDMPEDEKNLAAYFVFSMEEGHYLILWTVT